MSPPLRIAFPVSIRDLKARYALFVFQEHADENFTKTGELLGCTRVTAREWVKQGREARHRAEKAQRDAGTIGVDFIQIGEAEEEDPDAPTT